MFAGMNYEAELPAVRLETEFLQGYSILAVPAPRRRLKPVGWYPKHVETCSACSP